MRVVLMDNNERNCFTIDRSPEVIVDSFYISVFFDMSVISNSAAPQSIIDRYLHPVEGTGWTGKDDFGSYYVESGTYNAPGKERKRKADRERRTSNRNSRMDESPEENKRERRHKIAEDHHDPEVRGPLSARRT